MPLLPWPVDYPRLVRNAPVYISLFAAMIGMAIGGYLAMRCSELGDPVRAAHAEASDLAGTIRELGRRHGSCAAALPFLPEVRPASRLRHDPWGARWSIRCIGDLAVVRSAGPDAELGTEADVVEVAVVPAREP